jgi:hypothetical protein
LRAAATDLTKYYPLCDIGDAIKRFQNRLPPAPEHVGVLVASVVRLSREIDEAVIRRYAGSQAQLRAVADQVLCRYFDVKASSQPNLVQRDLLKSQHGSASRRGGILRRVLAEGGITATRQPISVILDEAYVRDLSLMTRDQLEAHLKSTRRY